MTAAKMTAHDLDALEALRSHPNRRYWIDREYHAVDENVRVARALAAIYERETKEVKP